MTADATQDLVIDRLGGEGDGIGQGAGGPVYVPFALAGDRVRVTGKRVEIIEAKGHQTPVCRHFTQCGGCVAQHMPAAVYTAWKHGLVSQAFRQRGIAADIQPLRQVAPQSRRRAVLTATRVGSGSDASVLLGFHGRGNHTLIDLAECPVLSPAIVQALPAIREVATLVLSRRGEGRITVTACDTGLSVAIVGGRDDLDVDARHKVARTAQVAGLAHLTLDGQLLASQGAPLLTMGLAKVTPPPSVFLQAVPEAEAQMVSLVTGAVGRAKRVVDLFSGLGTFTLPLAVTAKHVLAVDSDKDALAALEEATRNAQGLRPISTKLRDLMREPLARKELDEFDAAVFDPPRAGASTQAEWLAKSKVPVVVAVSCNPVTLARDAEILIAGGYKIGAVTPIDQFLFSSHVEVVAVFRRPK
jgi:23S rRNA (uracil1939-C5)-methyltransferase